MFFSPAAPIAVGSDWTITGWFRTPLPANSVHVLAAGAADAHVSVESNILGAKVGAAFAGLYLLTGSLWLPMILHAAVDILQGRVAYEVVRKTGDDEAEPSDKGLAAGSAS